jgi:hypothetical protein
MILTETRSNLFCIIVCIVCTSDCISSTDTHLTIFIGLVCDKSLTESLDHLEFSFLVIEHKKSISYSDSAQESLLLEI